LSWIGLGVLLSFIFIGLATPFLVPISQTRALTYPILLPPSLQHLMGTDGIGRDVFSRVLYGTSSSLTIMAIGALLALVVGFPLGLVSGFFGGLFDRFLLLVMDSMYAFPGLLLAALIAIMLGRGVFNIGIAITVIYIPLYFRVTRNQTLSAREELYVEGARAIGARPRTIMASYILFNVITVIPVIFSLSAADAILTAAGLSYLGFGLEIDVPGDWGRDLADAQRFLGAGIWWTSFFPGLMIIILTVGLSFLGEGLNDIINPLLRKERS
jgi:peptide/nickel transport system permease protein